MGQIPDAQFKLFAGLNEVVRRLIYKKTNFYNILTLFWNGC